MHSARGDHSRTKSERPGKKIAGLLAVLLLSTCGPEREEPVERIDIRPRWVTGDRYEVREERVHDRGTGPFPPAGELGARSERTRREIHTYRMEVLEARGHRLYRSRRTYLTSTREGEPTPVAGKTYEITDLFARCRVVVVGSDGGKEEAPPGEAQEVRLSALRMAGSLLPGGPVGVGESWRPGRDMSTLAIPGRKTVKMTPILRSLRETGGHRIARVECATDVRLLDGPLRQSRMTLRETVRLDVGVGRLLSYRAVTEMKVPPRPGRPESWRRQEAHLTLGLLR